MKIAPIAVLFLLALPSMACADSVKITKAEYGEKWPFTVLEGVLSCKVYGQLSNGEPVGGVTFTAKGKTYAVNGIAAAPRRMAENGWRKLEEIWKIEYPGKPPLRVNMGPIIERGLTFCN